MRVRVVDARDVPGVAKTSEPSRSPTPHHRSDSQSRAERYLASRVDRHRRDVGSSRFRWIDRRDL